MAMATAVIAASTSSHCEDEEEVDRCPKCNEPEKLRYFCAKCGHEYDDEELEDNFPTPPSRWRDTLEGWLIFLGIIIALWLVVTIVMWLIQGGDTLGGREPLSLAECFVVQWEWVKNLKLW
jgi:hypothetical protein